VSVTHPPRHEILIADHEGPWRDALRAGLSREVQTVRVTASGQDLIQALTAESNPPALVVIGSELTGLGALEALFMAWRQGITVKRVVAVFEVQSDNELMDVLRRRSVAAFIDRHDPIEVTVDSICGLLFFERRVSERVGVALEGKLQLGGRSTECRLEELSTSGAHVIVPLDQVGGKHLPVGAALELEFGFASIEVSIRAEVVEAWLRERLLLADEQRLAVRFTDPTPDQIQDIEDIMEAVIQDTGLWSKGRIHR
jgi:DNA-binding NarL/FixJ family response regulator